MTSYGYLWAWVCHACAGGGALFYASVLSLVHPKGRVHTIDPWKSRVHARVAKYPAAAASLWSRYVTYHPNSSLDGPVLEALHGAASAARTVLVILDANHRESYVAKEVMAAHCHSRTLEASRHLAVLFPAHRCRFSSLRVLSPHRCRQLLRELVSLSPQPAHTMPMVQLG